MQEKVYALVGNEKDLSELITLMENKKTTGEINCQYMNYNKVNNFFGWFPKVDLNEGLNKTIKWYERYLTNKYC